MNKEQKTLLAINLLGGVAVLGSYGWGILARPDLVSKLWGNTPVKLIPVFYATMLLAALGYIIFTGYLIFRLNMSVARINIRAGFNGFIVQYLLILIPSILWMPLTLLMIDQPGGPLWLAIRFVLLLVGVGGLGLVSALLSIQPRTRSLLIALIGSIFFCIQVVLIDPFIWPSFFVVP